MKQNKAWLEAAKENFEVALENEDVALLKDIIADTYDAGYPDAAREMVVQLRVADIKPKI